MRQLPAVLAFVLLCLQAALPWTSRHFVTQDGSSHLYGSVVVRDLLFQPGSPYRAVYTLQKRAIPNWTCTVLFVTLVSMVGVAHAEQLLATCLIVVFFCGFAYAARSFDPRVSGWSPLANTLIQTFFLTRGYYNFQFGMAFGLIVLGYGVRDLAEVTPRRAGTLALGWVILYFTHLMPAVLMMAAFVVVGLWVYVPLLAARGGWRAHWKTAGLIGASLVPAAVLILTYTTSITSGGYPSNAAQALARFPSYLFTVTGGRAGHQPYLFPGLLCLMVLAIATMKGSDWRSTRGGLLAAALITFGVYVWIPDAGFGGGGEIKVRVAWAVLLLAGVLATQVARRPTVWAVLSIYLALMTLICLRAMVRVNAGFSRQVDAYIALLNDIPRGSTVVRMRYPGVPKDLLFAPLIHTDSLAAAEKGLVELSNYEAAARIFPFVFAPRISREQQNILWTLDDSDRDGSARLGRLRQTLQADYYVLLSEGGDAGTGQSDLSKTIADLEASGRHLLKSVGDPPFVRLY